MEIEQDNQMLQMTLYLPISQNHQLTTPIEKAKPIILRKNNFRTSFLVKDYKENIRCILSTLTF